MFKNLYNYRELLKTNVKKEIRGKYKGSILGVLWSFINPLLQVVVYAIVFPYLMGASVDNYLAYLVTGIIPWTFFLTTVSQGVTTIKSNGGIVKKVYFPREILPLSVVVSGLVNFFISCVIIIVFCLASGIGVSWLVIFVPIVAIIQSILSLGLVLALSAINVYVQDMEYIVAFILNMLFYGTPIIYELSRFASAGKLHMLVTLNPMTQLINSYRDIFLYHTMPNIINLFLVFLLSIGVVIIGYLIFKKLEVGFAEEL